MVTKRQLGMFTIAAGALLLLATVAVDLLGAGGWGEFGPLQWLGVGLGALAILAGVPLVRLGNRPA
jgi:hypothetical protein